jgi:hypothetical protein
MLSLGKINENQVPVWLRVGDAITQANDAAKQLQETLTDNIGNVINRVQDRYQIELDYITKIGDYVDSLLVNQTLSPLTNNQRFAEAQAQFTEQLAAAKQGDTDALQGITGFAETLLREARGLFASSDAYTSIFNGVTDSLKSIGATSTDPKTETQQITTSIVDQTLALIRESRAGSDAIVSAIRANFSQSEIDQFDIFTRIFDDFLSRNDLSQVNKENFRELIDQFSRAPNITQNQKFLADELINFFNLAFAGTNPITTQIVSDQQITNFASNNKPIDIYNAAKQFDISVERLAQALQITPQWINYLIESTGGEPLRTTGRPVEVAANSGITDATIRDFVNANINNLRLIYEKALQYGISSDRLAANSPWTKEQILAWTDSQGLARFARGGVAYEPSIFGEAGPEAAVPLDNGYIPVQITGAGEVNRGLVNEVRELRNEVRALREEQAAQTNDLIGSNYEANEQASARIILAAEKSQETDRWLRDEKAAVY